MNSYILVILCSVFKLLKSELSNVPNSIPHVSVTNCEEVLHVYNVVCGLPVIDCFEDDKYKRMFWRIDTQLPFDGARAACRSATNADMAVVKNFHDQSILNMLFAAKTTLNTWMWIGITRQSGKLLWLDGTEVAESRWFWYPNSRVNGDCAAQLVQTNTNADSDKAGTFYYSENCNNKYIVACEASFGGNSTTDTPDLGDYTESLAPVDGGPIIAGSESGFLNGSSQTGQITATIDPSMPLSQILKGKESNMNETVTHRQTRPPQTPFGTH